jgi:hemerythrin-like domain-containing protein
VVGWDLLDGDRFWTLTTLAMEALSSVQIGQRDHNFSEPTALLSDCHRRIEMFLGLLEAAASSADCSLNSETARALTSALQYFREAAPKHTADEEESLFPRLRQIQHRNLQSALGKLEELEQDHRQATHLHAEIERMGGLYLSKGCLSRAEADNFRAAVNSLASMYREHIKVEDQLVFPIAARMLSRPEQRSIGEEMAARRNVKFTTEIARSPKTDLKSHRL